MKWLPIFAAGFALLVYWLFDNPLGDGFHHRKAPLLSWKNETLYTILLSAAETIVALYLFGLFTDLTRIPYRFPVVSTLLFTVVFGAFLTLRYAETWEDTLRQIRWDIWPSAFYATFFFVAITFGVGFGSTVLTFAEPSSSTVRQILGAYVTVVFFSLDNFQSIAGLVSLNLTVLLDNIRAIVDHMVGLYKNNGGLALRGGVFASIGAIPVGWLVGLVLIMGVNAGLIWGPFTGIQHRNIIVLGAGLHAPFFAYLASIGLGPLGHTIHEFMAIIVIGLGFGYATYGLLSYLSPMLYERAALPEGSKLVGVGALQLGFAAIVESTIDPLFIKAVRGTNVLEKQFLPYTVVQGGLDVQKLVLLVDCLVATFAAILLVVWTIDLVGHAVEPDTRETAR